MNVLASRGTGRPRRTGPANGPRTPLCRRGTASDLAHPASLERRTVSVLFVDIVGFTELAGRLEPEEVYAVQRAYFRIVAQVVREFHGVVEKYVGDAVMAVFGAHRPDAGDAHRAVRAGTEVVRRVRAAGFPGGRRVRVRAGVATGVVAVDPTAARDGGFGFVSGIVVNTAARVQAHAAPDSVAVTEATRAATDDRIRYLRLAPVRAAGIPGTLRLWQPVPSGPAAGRVTPRRPVVRPGGFPAANPSANCREDRQAFACGSRKPAPRPLGTGANWMVVGSGWNQRRRLWLSGQPDDRFAWCHVARWVPGRREPTSYAGEVPVERADDRPTTAYKLDRLFNDIRPEGRDGRRYTNEEVAATVRRSDPKIRVTGSYLSALRTGAKRNPSVELRVALARFFGVPAAYFLDDATAAQTDAEIELAKVASNLGVRRLALRALELTPEGLASVTRIVEHVLAADRGSGGRERLDASGGGPDDDHRGVAVDGGPVGR